MFNIKNDTKYIEIVGNILNNDEFNKIDEIEHHGISRLDHSLKVSYYSYKIAKALKLNYYNVARGGLLHDFFLCDNNRSDKEKFVDTFTHPKRALKKASETFELNDMEKDIIVTHMFPFYTSIPKYSESWLVDLTDKVIGAYEFFCQYSNNLNNAVNYLYLFILLNIVK